MGLISVAFQIPKERVVVEARGKGSCAIVTGREVDYGMARMGQVYMDSLGIEVMVFRELEHAEQWLDWDDVREAHAPSVETNHERQLE